MNVTPVPTGVVESMLNPDGMPPYKGPTGSVEGTLTVINAIPIPKTDDYRKCPDAEKMWGTSFRLGPVVGDAKKDARALGDALVVVTNYNAYVQEKKEAAEAVIDGCAYTSRTVTMTYGQRLDVRNISKDFWTPVLEPGSKMVMMMAPPKGDPVHIYPKQPGHYMLLDRDRKYAIVDVYAFLHPLHSTTDIKGHYRIDGLPVGKLKVNATHPQLDAQVSVDLTVVEGVVHHVDLQLNAEIVPAGSTPPPADAGSGPPPVH